MNDETVLDSPPPAEGRTVPLRDLRLDFNVVAGADARHPNRDDVCEEDVHRPGALRRMGRSVALAAAVLSGVGLASAPASAEIAVSWAAPAGGGVFTAGSIVDLTGNANASGIVGGTGLDLALVLDSSGSMLRINNGKSRETWLKEAASQLVRSLPAVSTSVAVIEFDTNATLLRPLTPLATGQGDVLSAIDSVDADGGTDIGVGIMLATGELTGIRHTAGRIQVIATVSDGESAGSPASLAAAARIGGVDAVHAVGLPGHSVSTMRSIAVAGNGVYTNVADLATLTNLFSGTGGNLVGLQKVDVTLGDGSVIQNAATDGLGNFFLSGITIREGDNTFRAVAYDSLGNSATATLSLTGLPVAAVPEPQMYALFGVGLGLLTWQARRKLG